MTTSNFNVTGRNSPAEMPVIVGHQEAQIKALVAYCQQVIEEPSIHAFPKKFHASLQTVDSLQSLENLVVETKYDDEIAYLMIAAVEMGCNFVFDILRDKLKTPERFESSLGQAIKSSAQNGRDRFFQHLLSEPFKFLHVPLLLRDVVIPNSPPVGPLVPLCKNILNSLQEGFFDPNQIFHIFVKTIEFVDTQSKYDYLAFLLRSRHNVLTDQNYSDLILFAAPNESTRKFVLPILLQRVSPVTAGNLLEQCLRKDPNTCKNAIHCILSTRGADIPTDKVVELLNRQDFPLENSQELRIAVAGNHILCSRLPEGIQKSLLSIPCCTIL